MPKPNGKRGKAVTTAERVAIQTMASAGTSAAQIARSLDRSRDVIARILKEAKETLEMNANFYVEKHLQATALAALDGNSKPAEWALERLRVVEPVQVKPDQGFSVHIGILLPGLGNHAAEVSQVGSNGQVIEAETLTARE